MGGRSRRHDAVTVWRRSVIREQLGCTAPPKTEANGGRRGVRGLGGCNSSPSTPGASAGRAASRLGKAGGQRATSPSVVQSLGWRGHALWLAAAGARATLRGGGKGAKRQTSRRGGVAPEVGRAAVAEQHVVAAVRLDSGGVAGDLHDKESQDKDRRCKRWREEDAADHSKMRHLSAV